MTINNNSAKNFHDGLMYELVDWLRLIGAKTSVPSMAEEAQHNIDNDDHGFDFKIGNTVFDFKGFSLLLINDTASWDSSYWHGRNPHREGLQNDFYVFPYGSHPSEWRAMPRAATRVSHKGYGPYCLTKELVTMGLLVGRCAK